LQQKDDSVNNHYQNALRTLDSAEKDINQFLDEIRDALAKHDVKGRELKESEEAARVRREHATSETSATVDANDKGKGKAPQRAEKGDEGLDHEDDPEDKGLPKTPAGEEHGNKRTTLKQRLREGLLILHRVKFLQGDVLHVLGDSAKEDAAYDAAEKLRRQLLQGKYRSVTVCDEFNDFILVYFRDGRRCKQSRNCLVQQCRKKKLDS
jgi:E3 ubiquitin-protein ligase SHPRH